MLVQQAEQQEKLCLEIAFAHTTVSKLVLILSFLFSFFLSPRDEGKRVEANLLKVSRKKTSLDERHKAQWDKHKLLLATQAPGTAA